MQQLDLLAWSAPVAAPAKAAAPWTDADIDELTGLYTETGGDCRAIAARMGRSLNAIWTKASYLRLAVTGNDELRKCLGDGCGKKFLSPDKEVRICSRCKMNKNLPWGF